MTSPDYYDIERSFLAFAESQGFPISDALKLDGKIHRFRLESDKHGARSGAYCVWPEGKSYDDKPHGWVQDHHEGGVKHFWQFYTRDNPPPREKLTGEDYSASRARKEVEDRQEAERRHHALKAAWDMYSAARPIEEACDHPYLLAKRIAPCGGFLFSGQWCGLRVGDVQGKVRILRNVLLIPLMDISSGQFRSLHKVFPWTNETGKYPKGWQAGTSGGVFPICVDVPRGVVFAGEGIATVLSWYQYWNEGSGNAEPCVAIAAIRARYLGRDVFILQDDDEAGERAAAACMTARFTGVINPRDYI
jgi:hypothetical protein